VIAPESSQERELIAFLDRLEEESESLKQETPLKDAELNLNFIRGLQWPQDDGSLTGPTDLQYKFVLNLLGPLVKRKTALLTDTRPQMEVSARYAKRRGTAETYKNIILAQWDEQDLEQVFTGELIRAMSVGSTVALPVWDRAADYGRGDVRYRVYDPRQVTLDPSVKRASHVPMAEFVQVRDVVPLNWVREAYPLRGGAVQASEKWSRYARTQKDTATSGLSGRILSAVGRAWSRGGHDLIDSAVPKVELRHTWFKDFPRDEENKPKFGVPRRIRHVVNAGATVLTDEAMVEWHQQYPTHFYDWDLELDHPWGIPEISGLRRIQYTLNRLIGQIVQNTLVTNRTILVSDTDAVDNKTWALLTSGLNGIAVRKKVGRTFNYTNPAVLPPHLITLVQLLITAVDMVSGMSDASRGMRPPGVISGVAIESLQQAAQSVVRLEARAFESWLSRIFQQSLALIWQYMSTKRLISLLGPSKELIEFEFDRQKFEQDDEGVAYGKERQQDLWQDFQFRVLPGSSLASTRVQRAVMALNLFNAGLVPGAEVLRAAEWPDPEGTYKQALEQRALTAQGAGQRPPKPVRLPGARMGGL
jgi:hypothetical protein